MTLPMKTDTAPGIASLQADLLRRLSGERRLALAVDMSLAARALLQAGLQRTHPTWSADRVRQELLRRTLVDPPVSAPGR